MDNPCLLVSIFHHDILLLSKVRVNKYTALEYAIEYASLITSYTITSKINVTPKRV